jgi:hypothetical protein
VEEEIAGLVERSSGMKAQWQSEKAVIAEMRERKEKLDELKVELDRASRTGDLNRAAEIQYGQIPALQKEIADDEARLAELQKSSRFLKEEVDSDDIAEVVAKWTGIPVTRMLQSDRERLAHLDKHLGQARHRARRRRRRRWPTPCAAPARGCRTPTGRSAPSSSWAPPAWGRRRRRAPSPSSSSTARRRWCAST